MWLENFESLEELYKTKIEEVKRWGTKRPALKVITNKGIYR